MKNLVIYTENYVYGGLERFLFDLLNKIDRAKYRVALLYNYNPSFEARFNRSVSRTIKRKNVHIYTVVPYLQRLEKQSYPRVVKFMLKMLLRGLNYMFFFGNIFLLSKEFSRLQIDILYIINGGYPGSGSSLSAVIAGRRQASRIILSVLSYPLPRTLKLAEKLIDSLISSFVDLVVTNSAAARDGMVKLRNFPHAKLRVVHTGIEDQEVNPKVRKEIRRQYHIPPSMKVVGMVGAFEPYKGHRYLLESIPLIKKKISNVKFILVGDGTIRKEMEDFAHSRGLSGDVIFTGYYPESRIKDIIDVFDVFVLPSLHEGLPYVILEAMSLGKPIVATNVGGIPEQLTNGVSGILVPPRDPKALADAIISLLTDKRKARKLGLEARKKVKRSFTLKLMVSSMEELFMSISRK